VRFGSALLGLTLLSVAAAGCPGGGAERGDGEETAPGQVTPDPLALDGEREGIVFRFLEPAAGTVGTATTVEEIPESARGQVVVLDVERPPPPGWELVVDLRRGLPATAEPVRGFTFALPGGAAEAGRLTPERRRAPTVVMFATEWCGYCRRARDFFKRHRVPFTEHDIERDPGAEARLGELARTSGAPRGQLQGVPVIFVGDQVVAGWDEPRLRRLLGL